MKPKEFVNTLRAKCESELIGHYNWCRNEAPGIFENVDFKRFIKIASNKPPRKFDITRKIIESYPSTSDSFKRYEVNQIEFEIDGAKFKVFNNPVSLAHIYRHASRAL